MSGCRDDLDAVLAAHHAAQPAGHPLDLDTPSPQAMRAIRAEDERKRLRKRWTRQKNAQRARADERRPLPYAALAGSEQLVKTRVIKEAQRRVMTLRHATRATGASLFFVRLRGRETAIVETWKMLQFLRIVTKDEPRSKAVGEHSAALAHLAEPETRRRQTARLLSYAAEIEASGTWSPFDLLSID